MNLKQIPGWQLTRVVCLWFVAALLSIAPSTFAVTLTNEYWIDDNAYGSNAGTLADPFIATNQTTFDNKMIELTSKSNVVIHLLPGMYRTAGNYAWYLKPGNRLLGSGVDVTTIKLRDNPGVDATVIRTLASCDDVQVENLTADCNGSTSTNQAHGVALFGERCVVRRVKVINMIGHAAPSWLEGFGIVVSGGVISECEVSSTLGNYNSAIAVLDKGTIIEKCRVLISQTNSGAAYNIGGNNTRLINSYSEGGSVAVYQDTINITNIVIANNVFRNCLWGVVFLPDYLDGALVDNNVIELNPYVSEPQYAVAFSLQVAGRTATVRGNIMRHAYGLTATNPVAAYHFWGNGSFNGATVNNNIWHNSFVGTSSLATNIVAFNNHDLAGNLIVNANQVEPANSIQRRSVAASTTLLPQDKFIGVQTVSPVTLTLPSAEGRPGKEIIINAEIHAPNITISRAGVWETINGAASITLTNGYSSRRLISDGENWFTY